MRIGSRRQSGGHPAPPRVLLAAESLVGSGSGIARVARLMARVLARAEQQGRLSASALVLNATDDLGLPARSANGSRARFVAAVAAAQLRCTHFVYDFAGMARAHPRLGPLHRPCMVWIHGIDVWEDARPDRIAQARAADVLVSNTDYTRRRAGRLHPGLERAHVCWLATETDDAPPAAPSPDTPTVTILSRLDEGGGYKGHRELIEAWPAVCREVPDARLCIAGAGPGRAVIEGLAARSPARDRIELLGFVPEPELDALWARTSVLAMPSRGEGFGLTYIEAMRHAIPVLASIHDAAAEINQHGVTGFNVDLDRPDQLAARLCELLTQPDHARTLGQAGQQRWREQFTFSAFERRFAPLLEELLAK